MLTNESCAAALTSQHSKPLQCTFMWGHQWVGGCFAGAPFSPQRCCKCIQARGNYNFYFYNYKYMIMTCAIIPAHCFSSSNRSGTHLFQPQGSEQNSHTSPSSLPPPPFPSPKHWIAPAQPHTELVYTAYQGHSGERAEPLRAMVQAAAGLGRAVALLRQWRC